MEAFINSYTFWVAMSQAFTHQLEGGSSQVAPDRDHVSKTLCKISIVESFPTYVSPYLL